PSPPDRSATRSGFAAFARRATGRRRGRGPPRRVRPSRWRVVREGRAGGTRRAPRPAALGACARKPAGPRCRPNGARREQGSEPPSPRSPISSKPFWILDFGFWIRKSDLAARVGGLREVLYAAAPGFESKTPLVNPKSQIQNPKSG